MQVAVGKKSLIVFQAESHLNYNANLPGKRKPFLFAIVATVMRISKYFMIVFEVCST